MSVKGGDVIFNFQANDKELKNSVNEMGTSIKNMVTALGLDRLINKTLSALNNSLDGAIKRVDTLNNFPRVMSNLGIATEEATESVNELSEGLMGLPTTLNDGVSAVQRFTSQNNDVKKSTKIFLALNNAILAGGASMEVQSSAMEQLSQAYAKGKPDAMEWRSMLTAMPAQLKQVALAMGYTSTAVGGDLYEAIQKGKISMDDFMDTIIRLNEEGVGQFASFEQQAKTSTGGIATSLTNVKTAITRGLANTIEAINKSLSKANLPTINEMIQNFGTAINNAFNKVNEGIKKINWNKITPIIKEVLQYMKNLKNTLFGFAKELFKKIDWDMVLKIAPTVLKIVATFKILNPLIKTSTSIINGLTKTVKSLASPVNLAITLFTAFASAILFASNNLTKEQQELKEYRDRILESTKSMEEFNVSVDDNLKKSLAQINNTKKLNDELKTLVDENGKVKEGYEDRVNFILNQLNDALGTEYKLNGDIIENYQDMQKEIDKLIEKKTAELKLSAEEEKYKRAIEDRTQAYEDLKEMVKKTGLSIDDIRKKQDNLKKNGTTNKEDFEWFITYGIAFESLEKTIETSTKNMQQYELDYALFTEGKFDEIGKSIVASTEDWTDETTEELKNSIKEQKKELEASVEIYKSTGEEKYKNQAEQNAKDLALLRSQLETRTGIVTKMTPNEVEAFLRLAQRDRTAFNDILSKTSGDTRNTLQNIANTIDANGYIPENSIRSVANAMISPIEEVKNNSYTWGVHFISNLNAGINNNKGKLFGTIHGIAQAIQNTLGHSHPKTRSNER